MTLDEQISFCEEKSKNIKLKTEPQTFVDIKKSLEKLKGQWISCSERLPKPEEEVLVTAIRRFKDGTCRYMVNPAIYEDGTVRECYSNWYWENIDGEWDEENSCLIIPEGWLENCKYNPECTYNCAIDDEVVAWMPLPEPYSTDSEKLQTNADRIRSMTDEELAKYLPMVSDFICQPTEECIKNTIMTHCGECEKTEECAMKWLCAESEGKYGE